jgi:Domain of unknown function (DUF3560)
VITITHTHLDGTLVDGTERGDGTAEILKAHRFCWFPSLKMWGIPQSRDHLAKRGQIVAAADALRAAGYEVTVAIDDNPRNLAEVTVDRAARLDERRNVLEGKAARLRTSALAHLAEADRIAELRPFGQPILVGHHSERRARADQRRIERNMDAFSQDYGWSKDLERRASVVGRAAAYRERPDVIIRRIATTEAELRRLHRSLAQHAAWARRHDRQPDPAHAEELEARRVALDHRLEADRAALQAAEGAGYRRYTRADVHTGDRVRTRFGMHSVVRVSAKSVSVETPYSWTDRVPYDRITGVECPHRDRRREPRGARSSLPIGRRWSRRIGQGMASVKPSVWRNS